MVCGWRAALVVLTVGAVLAVAGCSDDGGDPSASATPSPTSPSPPPVSVTAAPDYVDRGEVAAGIHTLPGTRYLPKSAALQGEGWRAWLSTVNVVREIPGDMGLDLLAFRKSLAKYGTPDGSTDLLAPAGHEFIVTFIAKDDGYAPQAGQPEPGNYQVVVGGQIRPIDLTPAESQLDVVVSVPIGADAILQYTTGGRTLGISLRTGKLTGKSAGGANQCAPRSGTGQVSFGFRSGGGEIGFVSADYTATQAGWTARKGWARAGRCWLTLTGDPSYSDPGNPAQLGGSPPDGYTGLEPKLTSVSIGGRQYSSEATVFDVPATATTMRIRVRLTNPRKGGGSISWWNGDGAFGTPDEATITLS